MGCGASACACCDYCALKVLNKNSSNTYKKIYYAKYAKVIKVIDGDTYDVAFFDGCLSISRGRVRLYGIDTPELKSRDVILKERACAAKKFAEDNLLGKIVRIDILNEKRDKYGRLLANIYVNKIDFAQELIARGFAVAYSGGAK